ncbi:MAG: septum formation protein Maf [Bacteroidia bacterium]|nr:septum formation protein Maf [Bacteroidia bacterium]
MKIILASKSPRRHELIKALEMEWSLSSFDVEETYDPSLKTDEIVKYLALKKAEAYPKALGNDEVLLTADTIVCINNLVLNKPKNEQEAFNMLKLLCGNTHSVYTGVCLKSNNKKKVFAERTEVTCKLLNDQEIRHYISSYQPFDKAGSYGIQDWFGYTAVEKINGCYYNVMGLPVSRIYDELKAF